MKYVALAKSYGIIYHLRPPRTRRRVAGCCTNLDPKRSDCPYPYKELSGCGISFKFAQALALHNNTPAEELAGLLDLVAVSIAWMLLPVTENRVLAHFGLQRLNQSPSIGLWALMQRTNRPLPLNINDLVFAVGPLINAAGRLGDARDAVRLMLSADRHSALDHAGKLVHRNKERREVDFLMASEASQRVLAQPDQEGTKSIVLFSPDWHKGIIGIAAGPRMAERFHRPSVILTQSNGRAVGSARSVQGFDLYAALQACEDLFYSYGGHAHAAGMQMPLENIDAFVERFEQIVQQQISVGAENPVLDICSPLQLEEITPAFWRMLQKVRTVWAPQPESRVFCGKRGGYREEPFARQQQYCRLSLRSVGGKSVFGGIAFGLTNIRGIERPAF